MSEGIVTHLGFANVMAAWDAYASRPLWFGFGTGSGQAEDATDLAAPVGDRGLGTSSQATVNIAGDTLRVTGSVTADEQLVITEMGVFDAQSGGNLDVYGDFPLTGIDLAIGDAITFQVSITVV